MPGTKMIDKTEPRLKGDFALVSVDERVSWREELPRHLLKAMHRPNGDALLPWKVDEQIQPVITTINELFSSGTPQSVQALEEYFAPASLAHRSDYAT